MPLYAYTCQSCNADFELLIRSSDVPACPACGSEKLQQQVARICVDIKYPAIAKSWAGRGKGRTREQFQPERDPDEEELRSRGRPATLASWWIKPDTWLSNVRFYPPDQYVVGRLIPTFADANVGVGPLAGPPLSLAVARRR